jgi:hypothetical protein
MDKMSMILKLPDGLREWLATEGDPLYRSATEQAAYLCSEYLKRAYKTAKQTAKNGTGPSPVEKNGSPVLSHD